VTEVTTTQNPALKRLPEELVASSLFLLKRLGMSAKERSLPAYEEAGVHPYHYAILVALDSGTHETQGSIADSLGYDKGQLVGLLDELEEAGLVERRRDQADRRRQIVQMTPAGKKQLEQLRRLTAQIEDEFMSSLSESEREQLHGMLLRLAEQHLPNCSLSVFPPASP
jgi:DNA-binding MarR family transcriptional regulator